MMFEYLFLSQVSNSRLIHPPIYLIQTVPPQYSTNYGGDTGQSFVRRPMHREDASGMLCISTPLSALPFVRRGNIAPVLRLFLDVIDDCQSRCFTPTNLRRGSCPLPLPDPENLSQEPGINRHWARHLCKRNRNIWIGNCHRDI